MCSNSSQHMRLNKVVQEVSRQGIEELEMQSHGTATKPKGVSPTYLSRYLVKETSLLKMQQTQTSPPLIHSHLQSIDPNTCSFPQKFHDPNVKRCVLNSPKAIQWSNTQLKIKKLIQMKRVFYQKGELRKIENKCTYLGFKE